GAEAPLRVRLGGHVVARVEHVGAARLGLERDLAVLGGHRDLVSASRVGQAVHGQRAVSRPGVGERPGGAAAVGVPVVQLLVLLVPGQQILPALVHGRPVGGDGAVDGDLGAIDRFDVGGDLGTVGEPDVA